MMIFVIEFMYRLKLTRLVKINAKTKIYRLNNLSAKNKQQIIQQLFNNRYFSHYTMSLSQLEQESKFKKHLGEYWSSKGITQIKIPQIGGQELNLFKLYKAVCKKGGGQAVSHNKLWKQIVDEFGLPSTCTSASFTLKNHYQKYLLGYEQRFFFGKDDNADLPQLVAGRQRKPLKDGESMMMSTKFGSYRPEGEIVQSTLAAELRKYYQKGDPSQHVSFIKRTKMYPVMSEVKHMILAFQSPQVNEINYGINMFLLFSMNTQAPFLFSQYPNVLEAIAMFIESHYPVKTIMELEYLRTLTLAIRNLLVNHKNLQPFLESPLVDVLGKIFEAHARQDTELIRNITDIFSSLSRIGWDCRELFEMIGKYLERDSHEDLETGVDLLRSLVEQKEEQCQQILVSKTQFFTRCLLHTSIQIRESILQIFAYMTEKSQTIRLQCLRNIKFMQRLFALMSNSIGILEKQAQLSCLIVNNISQLHQSEGQLRTQFIKHIRPFEHKLALISFNDESLSPITSSILFNLSGRVSVKVGKDEDKQKLLDKMRKNIERDIVSSEQDDDEEEEEQEQEEQQPLDQQNDDDDDDGEVYIAGSSPRKKIHQDEGEDEGQDDEEERQQNGHYSPKQRAESESELEQNDE